MWLLALFAVAGVGGVIRGLVERDRPLAEMLIGVAVTVICTALLLFFRAERRKSQAFATWLVAHARDINAGTATFDGRPILRTTPLRAYGIVVSLVVLSMREPTRPYVDREPSWAPRALCTLATLLFGWWGLPWGPIMTVQTVLKNLRGGDVTTVGKLLDGAVRTAQIAAARAAADKVAATAAGDPPTKS